MSVNYEDHGYVVLDDCVCKAATAKAIRVYIPDAEETMWIPLSQVHDDSEVFESGTEGTLIITAWLADQKEI